MYIAEKREELQTRGEPWPTCECHNAPMGWNRNIRCAEGGYFKCLAKAAKQRRNFRAQRKAAGLCIQCGSDELATETMCRPCADAHADLMNRPDQYLKHIFAQGRNRRKGRTAEGRTSTSGAAALLSLIEERTDGQI